ncbi:hypothetical protein [Nitratidesulfovibrio liaohensis]|uniref:hypothetical protein n=1 Tax=Nitratidesulfovibrio liaohensis TaxID=2604158 RepID=UPI0014221BC1|nr:hypothetical protein [Nitratidesulfovibrio liaohensis]NHZ48604.1 hypothetical protein [Nitratidesulfovibrio liaohensis]
MIIDTLEARGIAIGAGAALLLVLALLALTLWLRGDLAAARTDLAVEQAAHNATRAELAVQLTAKNLLIADQRASNSTITALSGQVNATQTLHREYVTREASRRVMLASAAARPRPPEETAKVVDHATRRAAADMLNDW